ncbi:MAG: serine/threonine protein kinase, partial [Planctomycetota bacterium]
MKIIGDRYQVISERTERSTLIYHVQNQRSNNNSSALRAPNQKIQNSEDLESRFKSACHALQAVRHENVLTALYFHDSGDLEDTCYLETEWFEESLRDVMDREDFAPHTKQTILVKLLSGVQAIHQSGMALGEFGPDLVHVDSICSTVKVGPSEKWLPLDSDDISLTPDISQYAAPELLEGLPDINKQRADVYAVGMFAYEFLLGRQQFQRTFSDIYNDPNADFNELWYNWQTDKTRIAEVLSDQDESIDPVLSAAVEWMIEKNPENRCPDISSALKQVSDRGPRGGLDIPPVPPPPPTSSDDFIDEASEPWWKWPLSETKNLIITVSVAVLLIVILAFWAAQPTAIGIKEDAVAKSNEYKAVKEQIDTLPDEAIKHLANKEAAAVKKWNIAIQFYEELNYTGS